MHKRKCADNSPSSAHAMSPSGWTVEASCVATSLGRRSFYVLGPDIAPRQTRIGRRVFVLEGPSAWLDRVARAGGVPKLRAR